jgi:carbon-monoxide dehydrogenase medium subunit
MYNFDYHRPKSVRQATTLGSADEAKFLAGGQTLLPTMKQRLASPASLVDLSQVEGLTGISLVGRAVVIGAMTRHADVATSADVQQNLPVLAGLAEGIGDPHVRNRGTIGGSIANNDPTADYPAACLGLGATIVTNKRRIKADDYFTGLFETALEPGELITKVSFPIPQKAAYVKFPNPASRYAMVGAFVSKRGREIRVAVTGSGNSGVFRLTAFEAALAKRFSVKAVDGLSASANDMMADIHGSAEYRAHLVGVVVRRAIAAAAR